MRTNLLTQLRSANVQIARSPSRRNVSRRGVLLLVVLSMLVLFMLIGTAFLMSSSQEQKTAKNMAKDMRVGNFATKLLDRALLQVLRDTDNQYSIVRYHSLLRDLYGTDGFQSLASGATYARQIVAPNDALFKTTMVPPRGATEGQFIDLYIAPLAPPVDDTNTPTIDESVANLTLQHVLKLDRDPLGRSQIFNLPMTRGYFNSCVLTMTSGPASNQSTRIIDYQFVGDDPAIQNLAQFQNADKIQISTNVYKRIWRIRVMAFGRTDGQSLNVDTTASPPAITDLVGQSFMVNGRAFSGTGVGYNPFAAPGSPRLSALEMLQMGAKLPIYSPVALMPNSVYFFAADTGPDSPRTPSDLRGARYVDANGVYQPLNPKITATMTPAQVTAQLAKWRYPNFVGLGDANESYDAADFQNMALALQTVTPRAQGRVVQSDGSPQGATLNATDPTLDPSKFLRLDLEDLPLPSFHRPDLVNYWYHQLLALLVADPYKMDPNAAALAIIDPYPNGILRPGLDQDAAALIAAMKRKVMMRPIREDHPHFTGSNPLSVPTNLPANVLDASKSNIAIPYWEAVGPWDVDNDNDGIPDSVWVDLGDPVQEAEDGTRYKPLYAFLIVDLDSRLNVNAHGLADEIVSPLDDSIRKASFDPTYGFRGGATAGGNIAHDPSKFNTFPYSTLQLSRGLGYGPAEISLRPLFPAPIINPDNQPAANRDENAGPIDSYATLLFGRNKLDGSTVNGKYGYTPNLNYPAQSSGDAATADMNYHYQPIVAGRNRQVRLGNLPASRLHLACLAN